MSAVLPLATTHARSDTRADSALRVACAIVAAYLALSAWPLLRGAPISGPIAPAVIHVTALALAIAAARSRHEWLGTVRTWLPLAVGPWLYVELRWAIVGAGRPHYDALVVGWEHALFLGDPSATMALRLPNVALSELLHLCYVSYYAIVLVPPLLLAARRERDGFARTMLSLAVVYATCFAIYLLFPVDGPRFIVGPAAAPDGPVRRAVLHLLAAGSSRGTAFPSSHVAASVVATLAALATQRRVGIVLAFLTAGLTVGTVYGGFHYAVDALAGLVVGSACWGTATLAWRALSPGGVQSATAP